VGDILANPVALAGLAALSDGFGDVTASIFAAIAALKTLGDALVVRHVRGHAMALRSAMWVPVKDLLMLFVWLYASVSRSVVWRGIKFRMGADSQLLPDQGPLPVRVLRRLLSA
jgi:hypothetical protein